MTHPAQHSRELYRPTEAETIAACETLLREGLHRETRAVIRATYERLTEPNKQEN